MLLTDIFCKSDWPHSGGQWLKFIMGKIE